MKSEEFTTKRSGSQTDWERLHRQDDEGIDYSDVPATTREFWQDAEVFMPKHKVHLSLRLDENVVDYFKRQGRGYQSKINAVLKAYVNAHKRHSKNI